MAQAGRSLLALLVAVTIGGCGGHGLEEQRPPAPPTAAELSRFVAETRPPAYWLGPRFRGITVSYTGASRGGAGLTYGPWYCDAGSGCSDSGGIWTGRRDFSTLSELGVGAAENCWRRVGRAVALLVDCYPGDYPQDLAIYSGAREIYVTSLSTADGESEIPVRAVIRGLRPLNARAPWPLQRPKPMSCRQWSRVARHYRRHMPQALQPRSAC